MEKDTVKEGTVNENGAAEAAPQEEAVNPSDIFITEIAINHVRHLHDIVIPLSKTERKNLILTGENGSGKSSVLEALSLMLFEHVNCTFHDEGPLDIEYSSNVQELYDLYRGHNFVFTKFDDERRLEDKLTFADSSTSDVSASVLLNQLLTSQILKRGVPGSKDSIEQANEIDRWFNRFRNVLRKLYNDDSLELVCDSRASKFVIHATEREPFDFDTMASGFSAIFDVIAYLLMIMEDSSPGNYDLPGIVLIDEIEVHLHVGLQKKILPILTELFPNLQFIVTTHSPFVLASAKNAVVYDLEHRTLAADGLSNVPYSGIVEGYFRVDEMSDKLEANLDAYHALAEKKERTDADYAEAARLELELDKVPDFLAAGWKAEYSRLKLEIAADKGE